MTRWVTALLKPIIFIRIFLFIFWIFLSAVYVNADEMERERTIPVVLKGDVLELRKGIYTAKGNVVVLQGKRQLHASSITLNNNTGEILASGNVKLYAGESFLYSESMMANLRTGIVKIDHGRIFIKEDNYHIKGDSIEVFSQERLNIKEAEFTTCDGIPPCWKFKGKNVRIHPGRFITANNVYFSVKDIPILYTPYIALPILTGRQTGFLTPRIGYNTDEGLKINNAFYWVISENQDTTIYGDYYGKKGWGSGLEYRYIFSTDTLGEFNGYYINDIDVERERWSIKYHHRQALSQNSFLKLRINYLKDDSLYKDISEKREERLQRFHDSDIYLSNIGNNVSMHIWAKYTQNLTGGNEKIFQRLPEGAIKVVDWKIGALPLYWNLSSSVSRWVESEEELTELRISPGMLSRFNYKGIIFTPSLTSEHLLYVFNGDRKESTNLYGLSATISTRLFKTLKIGSKKIGHLFEPSIQYFYKGGSSISRPLLDANPPYPVFKKGTDINTFLEEKNLLVLSFLNRILLTDKDQEYEPIFFRITQMFRVRDPDSLSSQKGFSDLRVEGVFRLKDYLSIDIDTTYSHRNSTIKYGGVDINFTGDTTYLKMGHRFSVFQDIDFFIASGGINLNKINVSADIWYDNKSDIVRESLYAVKYISQCWNITLSYRYRPEEEQFNLLFTLIGVGAVGGG